MRDLFGFNTERRSHERESDAQRESDAPRAANGLQRSRKQFAQANAQRILRQPSTFVLRGEDTSALV